MAEHTCPLLLKAPAKMALLTTAGSASSSTMAGSLPPSSSVTRFRSGAADCATFLPVSMDPVKLILRGTGCPVIHAPSSSPPLTTLSTPGGITPRRSSATFRVVSGVNGEGLSTRVLPASSAGAIFQNARVSGKFHGVMAPTTPIGRRTTSTRASASSWMTCGGVSRLAKYWHQMAEANTSMLASPSGFPCSAVSTGASSPEEARSTSAMANSVARRADSSDFQSRCALDAASKAPSSCSRLHSGAWANTSPLAGLTTPNESTAGTESPPMVMTKSDMWFPRCSNTVPGRTYAPEYPACQGVEATRRSDGHRLRLGRRGGPTSVVTRLGDLGVDGHTGKDPVQPSGEPPVGLPEQEHQRRDHGHPDDEGVDQDAPGQPEPELLDHPLTAQDERAEYQDHDQCGGGDGLSGGGQALADRLPVVPRPQPLLLDAGDQKDLVVHRQAEQDGEEHHRQERLDRTRLAHLEHRCQPAPLEHRHQDAEGGADGEEVHGRGGERDHDASEDHGQQEEREQHHQADEERQLGGEYPGEVDEDGGVATHVDLRPARGHGGGDGRVSEVVDEVGGGSGLR